MSIISTIKGFLRAFRRKDRGATSRHSGHSLARAMRDSTHVRGGAGGLNRSSTEAQGKIVSEGHEQYGKSFDKD